MKEKTKKLKHSEQDQPDYYIENGLMVFTESYLKQRGYCCERSCRHCPYGFKLRR